MIMYRNPLDQWFWEGGYIYFAIVFAVFIAVYFGYVFISGWIDRRRRIKRWVNMPEEKRKAWRDFNKRNNIQLEEGER